MYSIIIWSNEVRDDFQKIGFAGKVSQEDQLLLVTLLCFNFSLSMQSRQVVLEGEATPLSHEENAAFWSTLPRERQLRFTTYAPTSGQVIPSLEQLEQKKKELAIEFENQPIPMCDDYFGFRFIPHTWYFYTMGSNTFSEMIRYHLKNHVWHSELLSP